MKKKDLAKKAWAHLKNKVYNGVSNTSNKFTKTVDDIEIEYDKIGGNIYRSFNHRFAPSQEKQLVTIPKTDQDREAFDYFTQLDINNGNVNNHLEIIKKQPFIKNNHTIYNINKSIARNFSTAYYKSKIVSSEQNGLKPNFEINTSVGLKKITSLSYHKDKKQDKKLIQVNDFADNKDYLTRVQSSSKDNLENEISSPVIWLGKSAEFTHEDFKIQMDLYCIKEATYDDIILLITRHENNNKKNELLSKIEVASKFTGHAKLDEETNQIKMDKDGIPETKYQKAKGRFVSMEAPDGNTVLIQLIAEKTQELGEKNDAKLFFIPVDHPSIKKIFNVSEVLSDIKDTYTKEPDIIDFIFKKHDLSVKEVAVSLINVIETKNSTEGVFSIELNEFKNKYPEFVNYVYNTIDQSSLLDQKNSYSIRIDDQKDEFGEVILHFDDLGFIDKKDRELIGNDIVDQDSYDF